MMKKFLGWLAAASIVVIACGGDDSTTNDGGGGDAPFDSTATTDASRGDSGSADSATGDSGSKTDSGGAKDSGSGGDSGGSDSGTSTFTCAKTTCDPKTQYCSIVNLVGIGDGGINSKGTCTTYPATCAAKPSCSCIKTAPLCTCKDIGGDITVTCTY